MRVIIVNKVVAAGKKAEETTTCCSSVSEQLHKDFGYTFSLLDEDKSGSLSVDELIDLMKGFQCQ